jgi:dehydration protein DpgD
VSGREDRPRVRCETRGRVAWVTLDRPEVLNAMDLRTHEELGAVLDRIEADDEVWAAVLTGAGDRAFCVGQDLRERAALSAEGDPPTSFGSRGRPGWPRLTERFDFAKPLVARVNGYALGGGFELVLACDIAVAVETAEFGLPEATLGLVPGAGGAFRLARQIPLKTAMGHLLTGRRMTAPTALSLGLVNQVVPAERLDEAVGEWTADLVRAAPLAVRAIKEAAMRSLHLPLEQAFAADYGWERRRLAGVDHAEGPAAFAGGRDPVWRDR